MTEWNLSDKEKAMFEYSSNPLNLQIIVPSIPSKDVREAFKRLKDFYCKKLPRRMASSCGECTRCKWINKLAGEKLI